MILLGNKQNNLILLGFFHFLGWRSPYIIFVSAPPGKRFSLSKMIILLGNKQNNLILLGFFPFSRMEIPIYNLCECTPWETALSCWMSATENFFVTQILFEKMFSIYKF